MAELLVNYGASLNEKDDFGNSIQSYAAGIVDKDIRAKMEKLFRENVHASSLTTSLTFK